MSYACNHFQIGRHTCIQFSASVAFKLLETQVDKLQTQYYSYRLAMSYQPKNYIGHVKKINRSVLVIIGKQDEAIYENLFASVFKPAEKFSEVKLTANATHLYVLSNQNAQENITEWYATKLN